MFSIEERMWEWLTGRLDRQDQLLNDVLRELRANNQAIGGHETRLRVLERADAETEEHEHERAERRVRDGDMRSRRRELAFGSLCVLLGGSLVHPFLALLHTIFH